MKDRIDIKRTSSDNLDFKKLVRLLDADLQLRDGNKHTFYAQFNKIDMLQEVIVAYIDAEPVGCGAIKKFDTTMAEIKRMFVQPEWRGKSIAQKILSELEKWAREKNFLSCILETGKKQPEAIRLYTKSGYNIIPNYGQYIGIENSICMEKRIDK
jgi:GNAT superfamily N-acetyltransferase